MEEKKHTTMCGCACLCVHTHAMTHATVRGMVISPRRIKFELDSPLAPYLPLVRNLSLQKH